MTITVAMPQLGESVVEGTIGKWLVKPGDQVSAGQPVVEILTDKADSEVPTPNAGTIVRLLAPEGAVVKVGTGLVEIDETGTVTQAAEPKAAKSTPPKVAASSVPAPKASPAVRKEARDADIDLGKVRGTGDKGRITKEDVLKAKEGPVSPASHGSPPAPIASATATVPTGKPLAFQVPPYIPRPGDQLVPFSRRRRIIADHMVYSKLTSPHVVTFAECDLARTAKLRDTHKDVAKRDGVNLTYLAFIAAATARALRENPTLNARVLDDAYVLLKDIHLGIAVETPEGLVVPVVRHADDLTVRGLARAIDEVAKRARDGKLTPDDLAGKTFTISNPGLKGNLVGGAIISQPNVAILRTGTIKKRVVVLEHDGEDVMAIHPVMHMALSYDHRIVDGVAANAFLYRVSEILEAGDFVV